jgi:spore coat protein U-like protein
MKQSLWLEGQALASGSLTALLGMALMALASIAHAQANQSWKNYSCSINSASLSFGTYNPLSAVSLSNNAASLTMTCSGGTGSGAATPTPTVGLSTGSSLSFSQRTLKSGNNTLNYNVFTDSAYSIIWGEATTGSAVSQSASIQSPKGNATSSNATSLTLYGRIPSGQLNAAAGNYSDTLTITVTY